jgi:hypothetical protein
MPEIRALTPDFLFHLGFKEKSLADLFHDLRAYVLELCPGSNELLYHTHALTTTFTVSERLADAFCMIPVYTRHLNLGFNKGTLLHDPHRLLQGTGNLIRHIPVSQPADYRNKRVRELLLGAADLAIHNLDKPVTNTGQVISKIKAGK